MQRTARPTHRTYIMVERVTPVRDVALQFLERMAHGIPKILRTARRSVPNIWKWIEMSQLSVRVCRD